MVILGLTRYQPEARNGEGDHLSPREESFSFVYLVFLFQQPLFLLHIYHVSNPSMRDAIQSSQLITTTRTMTTTLKKLRLRKVSHLSEFPSW